MQPSTSTGATGRACALLLLRLDILGMRKQRGDASEPLRSGQVSVKEGRRNMSKDGKYSWNDEAYISSRPGVLAIVGPTKGYGPLRGQISSTLELVIRTPLTSVLS